MVEISITELQEHKDEWVKLDSDLARIPVLRNGKGSGNLTDAQMICKCNIRWLDNLINKTEVRESRHLKAIEKEAEEKELRRLASKKRGEISALDRYNALHKDDPKPTKKVRKSTKKSTKKKTTVEKIPTEKKEKKEKKEQRIAKPFEEKIHV